MLTSNQTIKTAVAAYSHHSPHKNGRRHCHHMPKTLRFQTRLFPPNSSFLTAFSSLKIPSAANSPNYSFKSLKSQLNPQPHHRITSPVRSTTTIPDAASIVTTFHGLCYVVGDNIDTDLIIPVEYLTLVPSNPDEYKYLGSYALIGLPSSYETRFIDQGEMKSKYSIVIGRDNFGCGSSREHVPVALGAFGVAAVVAESYARIFFRNSVATREVYPVELEGRLCKECNTGDVVTIELGKSDSKLINHTSGKEYKLKPIRDAGPVIAAGGIFAYARKTRMIPSR